MVKLSQRTLSYLRWSLCFHLYRILRVVLSPIGAPMTLTALAMCMALTDLMKYSESRMGQRLMFSGIAPSGHAIVQLYSRETRSWSIYMEETPGSHKYCYIVHGTEGIAS